MQNHSKLPARGLPSNTRSYRPDGLGIGKVGPGMLLSASSPLCVVSLAHMREPFSKKTKMMLSKQTTFMLSIMRNCPPMLLSTNCCARQCQLKAKQSTQSALLGEMGLYMSNSHEPGL